MGTTHVVVRAGSEETLCGRTVTPLMGLTFDSKKATCRHCKKAERKAVAEWWASATAGMP